jgi:hypothetical protein
VARRLSRVNAATSDAITVCPVTDSRAVGSPAWKASDHWVGVGGVAIGLLSSGTPDTAPPTTTPATTADKPSPAATATVGAAEARVNAACLRVISEAQEVYDVLSGVGEAADDVDLQRLDDMVRQLQRLSRA